MLISGDFRAASVKRGFSALGRSLGNQALNPLLASRIDHRAHLDAISKAVAYSKRRRQIRNRLAEPIVRVAHSDRDGDRQAALPGATVRTIGNDLGRGLTLRIRQDHHVIFCAALALHALSIRCRARVDVARHGRGTHKANGLHGRVIEQSVHRGLPTVHQIQNAFGHARAVDQLENPHHAERHTLRRLQHKCIAACDCVRQEPQRDHRRKIERCDSGNHAQRLAEHRFINAARHVFQVVALHQDRNPTGHLHVFDAPAQFAASLG